MCTVPLRDVTTEILRYWRRKSLSIPTVEGLAKYLDTCLPERGKIPVDQNRFEALMPSPMQLRDRAERRDLEMLFRIDPEETAEILYVKCSWFVFAEPPGNDATENAFISFWDVNLRNIVEMVVPGGVSIRDNNRKTSTASLRPDFGFLYLNSCSFRGAEKAPTNKDDPRAELSDNMIWTYDPAPYVLGPLSRQSTSIPDNPISQVIMQEELL